MSTVIEDNTATAAHSERNRREQEEIAQRIEKRINDAKSAVSERLEESKHAAGRLVKQGRYAVEDGLSDLAHHIRRNPMKFLGIAFAAGAALGLILALTAKRPAATEN